MNFQPSVSSPSKYNLEKWNFYLQNFSDLLKPYNRYAHPYDVAKRTQLYYDQDCKHAGKKLVKNGEIIVTVVSLKIIASLYFSKIYSFVIFEFLLDSTRAKTKIVPNVQKALLYINNYLILEMWRNFVKSKWISLSMSLMGSAVVTNIPEKSGQNF